MKTRYGVYNAYGLSYTGYDYKAPLPINNGGLFAQGKELRLNWDNVVLLAVF